MSQDVATLGIRIDSADTLKATTALDGLTAAAKPAAVAVDGLEQAAKDAGAALTPVVNATTAATTAATGLGAAATKTAPALVAVTKGVSTTAAAAVGLAVAAAPAAAAVTGSAAAVIGLATAAAASTPALNASAKAATAHASAHQGLSSQAQSAGHSIRSMVEGLASGMPVSTVLTQQFGHLSYAASGKSGLAGAFAEATGALLGFLSPTVAVVGGIAAIGLGAVAAASSWTGAQHAVQLGLMGIGRASQVTAGDINNVAAASASLNGLSVSQARETATTLASTGKIGLDNITLLTGQTKNFAAILGTDVPKAAEAMAKIFANPTEGAKTLAATIGGIDSETVKYVETLEQQGNRQAAIKVLIDAVVPAIAKASEQTGTLASGWNSVGNLASNAYTAIGKALAGSNSEKTVDQLNEQRASLEGMIEATTKLSETDTGSQKLFDLNAIKQYRAELAVVVSDLGKAAINKTNAAAVSTAQDTLQLAPVISSLVPASDSVRGLTATVELLSKAMTAPEFEAFRQKMGDDLPLALERAKGTLAAFIGPMQAADPWKSQIVSLTLQNQLLNDNSPAMRRKIAEQLAYNAALKGNAGEADARAIGTLAGAAAYGGTATDIQSEQPFLGLFGPAPTASQAAAKDEHKPANSNKEHENDSEHRRHAA